MFSHVYLESDLEDAVAWKRDKILDNFCIFIPVSVGDGKRIGIRSALDAGPWYDTRNYAMFRRFMSLLFTNIQ